MALHRLTSVTMGVPNVEETAAYYADFGLQGSDSSGQETWFSTRDGGRQLRIVPAATRRLVDLHVGVDDADDLARAEDNLHRLGLDVERGPGWISAVEKVTGTRAYLEIAGRLTQDTVAPTPYNGPGRTERPDTRAPGILRGGGVAPRKLGHAVMGSTDPQTTEAFFVSGLGFKISDRIKGAGTFMRCSTDHHNVLVLGAPVSFLHHTSWQVDDVDEVGRGAAAMLEDHPERHVWGLGLALRRVELLLVPQGPGRQLQRVLQRHGLHRRRPAVDARGPRGRPRPVRLGPAPAAVFHPSRRSRRHDDRRPHRPLSGPEGRPGSCMAVTTCTLFGARCYNHDVLQGGDRFPGIIAVITYIC